MKRLLVDDKYDNKKLNTFLMDNFDGLSINTIYKALRKKDIIVNNVRVKGNVTLHTNDIVIIYIKDEYLSRQINIDIIYEDNNIIIINKPTEIEVVGNENSLTQLLIKFCNSSNIFPCHRLDRNTTGLVLFAKNQEALSILLNKFKNHEIEKHYLCTIYGIPSENSKLLTAYLLKDSKKNLVYISDIPKKGYQKIITSYKVISKNNDNNTSVLDINLHTGKTHQIRAHLAHIGFPIIGDGKYGNNKINKQFNKKYQELCAYKLIFNFINDSGILNYLNGKEIVLKIKK